jgi:hypothetical protein
LQQPAKDGELSGEANVNERDNPFAAPKGPGKSPRKRWRLNDLELLVGIAVGFAVVFALTALTSWLMRP